MKVIEEMAEVVFNTQVPIELLKCYIREDMALNKELDSIGAVSTATSCSNVYYSS